MQLSSTKHSIIYQKKKKFQPTKSQKVALSNCPLLSPKGLSPKRNTWTIRFNKTSPKISKNTFNARLINSINTGIHTSIGHRIERAQKFHRKISRKKKKISKEDKGTARRREEERSCFDIPASLTHLVPARVLPARLRRISRFSISSSSPTPSHACAYTFTSIQQMYRHISLLYRQKHSRYPPFLFSSFLFFSRSTLSLSFFSRFRIIPYLYIF